jgi:alkylation response protein AidB-like acyl-CoA dehydrogenase
VAVSITDAGGSRDGGGVTALNDTLNGRLLFALGAPGADLLICSCTEGDLYAVPRAAPGLEWIALRSIDDTRCLWELNLQDVAAELLHPGEGDAIAPLGRGGPHRAARPTRSAPRSACWAKAVAYAGERQQFKRLIGSFQAVKHMCAEMAAELEPCRALWYAAHAFDTVPGERTLMACHAKAHLSEVGTFIARTATEVHGGMGFTDLLGLHYWFKRIGATINRQLLG